MKIYVNSNDTITASWNGQFSSKYIMDNSETIPNRSEAKKLSDYLWDQGVDSGWRDRDECFMFLEKWRGGFDKLYDEMKRKEAKANQ